MSLSCDADDECSKGKKCRPNGEGRFKICQCPPGKSGDDCEKIDDCVYGKYKNCKGDNGICENDDQGETAVCRCEGGKELDETIASCSNDADCNNRGTCGADRVCSCKRGASGDLCETITGCNELNCSVDISQCVLDETTGKGVCQCNDQSKVYSNNKCMASFSNDADCNNRGTCGADRVCSCKRGASGDLCEFITGCDELKCSVDISQCVLDETTGKGVCKCNDESKVYSNNNVWVTSCSNDADCNNRGTCGSDRVCSCKRGASGDLCETITGCEKLKCSVDISQCVLDETTGKGVCQCNDQSKVYSNNKCMASCSNDADCNNRGTCGADRVCSCKRGASGDLCETITGCDELKCSVDISQCVLDETTGKGVCKCNDESKVYSNNNVWVTSCSNDADCNNRGTCGSDRVCSCKRGASGDLCETITGCEKLKCSVDISQCVLDETTGKGVCQCNDQSKVYSNNKCMASCSNDADCNNRGTCGADRVCSCKRGASGDLCETITGCNELKCFVDISQCVLDETTGKGVCQCKVESKVYSNNKCMASCSNDADCNNKGTCGFDRVCSCKRGASGDLCETITGCDELKCSVDISQ
ncbi:uncharacterized protein TNCT_318241 [Trichonephila clavata]|uniref:EGF-like domain-containing protein n=1 Tax=Trichonephila clavata TaxID=2740835 RepID=A0A8X6FU75_TRICU|nr:uncharacterized protein TNCT_318241 [Trichonephila clavata]